MIINIHDQFLSSETCDKLVEDAVSSGQWHHDTAGQHVSFSFDDKENLVNQLEESVNKISAHDLNVQLDWFQLVRWDQGTGMNYHFDLAKPNTVFASIIYLNDDYDGGETIFLDGTLVAPKKGRVVFFDGCYHKHGVNIVDKGTRYVIASWYCLK